MKTKTKGRPFKMPQNKTATQLLSILCGAAKGVLTALAYPRGSEAQIRCMEEIGSDIYEIEHQLRDDVKQTMAQWETERKLNAAAPEMAKIMKFLREHIAEGASVIHLDALFGDDETTLCKAINGVCKKLP